MAVKQNLESWCIIAKNESWQFRALLLLAIVLFSWGVAKNELGYTYYSMAAQSAADNWTAFLFGSLDKANFIAVDKPPFAIWPSAILVKIFGLSWFSVLAPHILAGVGSVALLYKIIRLNFSHRTSMLAGIVYLLTPVTAVVFRYNTTDSIFSIIILWGMYSFVQNMRAPTVRRTVITGTIFGLAFFTKMAQALIVLPVLAICYLLFANQKGMLKRASSIVIFGLATLFVSLMWPIMVWLTPVEKRPYVGSTTNNSIWQLIAEHNGIGRLTARNWKQPKGDTAGIAFGGQTGPLRVFNAGFAPTIAWMLLPSVALGLVALIRSKKQMQTLQKNQLAMWLGIVITTIASLSTVKGIIHPYWTVSLAPAVAATLAIALSTIKKRSDTLVVLLILSINALFMLPFIMNQHKDWPAIINPMLYIGIALSAIIAMYALLSKSNKLRITRREQLLHVSLAVALITSFIPQIYSVSQTISKVQYGLIPTAQPTPGEIAKLKRPDQSIPKGLSDFLLKNTSGQKWVAASFTSYEAAPIQFSTNKATMALGGFSGDDDPLSLDEFKNLVDTKQIRYVVFARSLAKHSSNCSQRSSHGTNSPRMLFGEFFAENLRPRSSTPEDDCSKTAASDSARKSTRNIAVWAKTRQQVRVPGAEPWRVYDLWHTSDATP